MAKFCVFVFGLALFGLSACGNKEQAESDKVAKAVQQSFEKAPDALKSNYDDIKAAIARNELVKAKAGLDQLRAQKLSQEQQQAAIELRQELMYKAAVASQQGDANAAKIVQALRGQ